MGWSVALLAAAAFVLISLSSASEDERLLEQREVTFDIHKILQEMQQSELTGNVPMQEELDWKELFKPIVEQAALLTPRPLSADELKALNERGPTMFGPRSAGYPPALDYPVQFPPGRPSLINLQAICLYGDRRPRYSKSYFPASGFGALKRRAAAVNNAESWFDICCKGNQTWEEEVTLCCATQVWELAVNSFCQEDSSVKDRIYHCCRLTVGNKRLDCFQKDAPNPNYEPTEEVPLPPLPSAVPFNFDNSTCQDTASSRGKKQKKPLPSPPQNVDISFPPGRPTAADIESLCRYRKLRPHYNLKCLPHKGYGWLARQSKTINRVEKGFKQCCKRKQDVLACADGKWCEEMNRFCREDKGARMNFPCCEKAKDNERYDCFQARAPHPSYDLEPSAGTSAAAHELSLDRVCATHKIIRKKFPVGIPLQSFVNQCCPLSEDQQTSCIKDKLVKMSGNLCPTRNHSSPALRRCCRMSAEEVSQCLSKILMDAISKATNVSPQKKKKCPLS
ncbi:hypothetical protein LDENG_00146930 [Lucifuga dentata]|nr:hypothetical protein LDENG_00146930 [Lucifuga dentata]